MKLDVCTENDDLKELVGILNRRCWGRAEKKQIEGLLGSIAFKLDYDPIDDT